MFLSLKNDTSDDFIYQKIYKQLKKNILEKKVKSNEKLPSKRHLAKQLNISINSVTNAYEQLLAEGYIYTLERKGYYVENISLFDTSNLSEDYHLPLDLKEKKSDSEGFLSLSHMTVDITEFPFNEWAKCQQKAIKHHQKELSEITHPQGPFLVRESIAKLIRSSRGVLCEPEQIIIDAGTQSLIRSLMDIQQNETIFTMENPGYLRIYNLLKNMNIDVRTIPLDNKGIDLSHVDPDTDFLFVTPSHQFPTGKIMPISRRVEILNWSTKQPNRYIIEDDYDSEFKYETDNIPSLQSLDRNQRVIYTGTFSKIMVPGLRISYMVLPPELLKVYKKQNHHLIQSSNLLTLYTLHYFIEDGGLSKHLKKMNQIYKIKRKKVIEEIKNRFKNEVEIEDIPAGLHFLARFKSTLTYDAFEKRIKQEKLEVYSIKRFILDKQKTEEGVIELVIGFAKINLNLIPHAVDRLYRALSR